MTSMQSALEGVSGMEHFEDEDDGGGGGGSGGSGGGGLLDERAAHVSWGDGGVPPVDTWHLDHVSRTSLPPGGGQEQGAHVRSPRARSAAGWREEELSRGTVQEGEGGAACEERTISLEGLDAAMETLRKMCAEPPQVRAHARPMSSPGSLRCITQSWPHLYAHSDMHARTHARTHAPTQARKHPRARARARTIFCF